MSRQVKKTEERKEKKLKGIDLTKGVQAKRFAKTSGRYYGPIDENIYHNTTNPLKPSWTTISNVESAPGLQDWFKTHGKFADFIGPTSAIIGTITHECVDLLNAGEVIDSKFIENMLMEQADVRWRFIYPHPYMAVELIRKQIASYCAFHTEHQPRILASEMMLWHPDVPWAGTADFLFSWYSNKQKQEVYMLGDLKTGAEQDKHFVQCQAYALLVEKIFDIKISILGVLHCTGKWRTKPTFKLKVKEVRNKAMDRNDASKVLIDKALALHELWKINQKYEQPISKPMVPSRFKLKLVK